MNRFVVARAPASTEDWALSVLVGRLGTDRAEVRRRARVVVWGLLGLIFLYQAHDLWGLLRIHVYGFDFHGGIWLAGRHIVHGQPVYGAPNAARLAAVGNAYIPPPLLAEAFLPVSLLPFSAATMALNLGCLTAMVVALWLMGVRQWELYALCLLSVPFVFSLGWGDPDALYALLLAVCWRYRDRWPAPVAVGALIAAKLLLWPLVIWLVATRRIQGAIAAVLSAAALILIPWALIGFQGLARYPQFLIADGKVQSTNHSLTAVLRNLGMHGTPASVASVLIALAVGWAIARAGRYDDRAWFVAAIVCGLLSTTVMFPNYYVIVFILLALRPRRLDLWALTMLFFIPVHPGTWQVGFRLLLTVLIALGIVLPEPRPTTADPARQDIAGDYSQRPALQSAHPD